MSLCRVVMVWLAAVVVAGSGASAADSPDPADAAFEAGEADRALALYEERLAADPDDVGALVRAAQLRSWREQYDEALARYDRALALDPGHRLALSERAKVLSWAGRQDEAAAAFRAYLARYPDDREARLALARSLGWAGRHDRARAELGSILAARPDDVDALVTLGRVESWSGRLRAARDRYREALALDPANLDAAVGLGWVHLWAGDASGARRRARALAAEHPDDAGVEALAERSGASAGPRARVETEAIDDSDDNELRILRAGASFGLGPGLALDVAVSRWDLASPGEDATIDTLDVDLAFRAGLGVELHAFGGIDRTRGPSGTTDTDPVGGVSGTIGLDRRWQATAALARRALRYSPAIADARVLYDEAAAGVRGRVARRWRVAADLSTADFDDGNRRSLGTARASWAWPIERVTLATGYSFRALDFAEDLDHGYFDPQEFTAHLAELGAAGGFGGSRARWAADLAAGVQSFTLGGVRVSNDAVLIAVGSVTVPLGREFELALRAGWGDYAAQTAAGFSSREILVGLRWSGGP